MSCCVSPCVSLALGKKEARELTLMTRGAAAARSAGISRLVSRKWPRKLTWRICSSPSAVSRRSGMAETPALLMSASSVPCRARKFAANLRTLSSEARSSSRSSTAPDGSCARIRSAASVSLASERPASTTVAPSCASRSAVS